MTVFYLAEKVRKESRFWCEQNFSLVFRLAETELAFRSAALAQGRSQVYFWRVRAYFRKTMPTSCGQWSRVAMLLPF